MDETVDVDVFTLDDGKEYVNVEQIILGNNNYLFLSSVEDRTNFCIRKRVNENGEELLVALKDQDEFADVIQEYVNKHSGHSF